MQVQSRKDDVEEILGMFRGCVFFQCSDVVFHALVVQFVSVCNKPGHLRAFTSQTLANYSLDAISTGLFTELLRARLVSTSDDLFVHASRLRADLDTVCQVSGRQWGRHLWNSLKARVTRLQTTQIGLEEHIEVLQQFLTYSSVSVEKLWRLFTEMKLPRDVTHDPSMGQGMFMQGLQDDITFHGLWRAVLQPCRDLLECGALFDRYEHMVRSLPGNRLQQEYHQLQTQLQDTETLTLERVTHVLHENIWFSGVCVSIASLTNCCLFDKLEYLDVCIHELPRIAQTSSTWHPTKLCVLPVLFVQLRSWYILRTFTQESLPFPSPTNHNPNPNSHPLPHPNHWYPMAIECGQLLTQALQQLQVGAIADSDVMSAIMSSQQWFSLSEEARLSANVAALYLFMAYQVCSAGSPGTVVLDLGVTLSNVIKDASQLCQHLHLVTSNNMGGPILPLTLTSMFMIASLPLEACALLLSFTTMEEAASLCQPLLFLRHLSFSCLESCSTRAELSGVLLDKARTVRRASTFMGRLLNVNEDLVGYLRSLEAASDGAGLEQDQHTTQTLTMQMEEAFGGEDADGMLSNIEGLPNQYPSLVTTNTHTHMHEQEALPEQEMRPWPCER